MKRFSKRLLIISLFAASAISGGCTPAFLLSPEGLAGRIHEDMQTIHTALERYAADHGTFPAGGSERPIVTLVEEGYLRRAPKPVKRIFGGNPAQYGFSATYDNMDGIGAGDSAIYIYSLKDEICRLFNMRFSSDDSGPTIYDYEAAGKTYPGERIGRNMKTYAIKWNTADIDDCEIEWVVRYND